MKIVDNFKNNISVHMFHNVFLVAFGRISTSPIINSLVDNKLFLLDDEILTQDQSGNIILHNVKKSIKSILVFNTMQVSTT